MTAPLPEGKVLQDEQKAEGEQYLAQFVVQVAVDEEPLLWARRKGRAGR